MASSEDTNSVSSRYNVETLRIFEEAFECTEDDLKFQFTDDQLKEICLKHKCRVMASRWNIVYEYGLWLKKEGRFEGRSLRYQRGMLTKGVNRHKARLLYDEGEIQRTLEKEWRFRKKDNILSLRLWEREREPRDQEFLSCGNSSNSISGEEDEEHEELNCDIIMMASSSQSINSVISNVDETESQALYGNVCDEGHHQHLEEGGDYPIDVEFIDGDDIELYVEQDDSDQIETMYTDSQAINKEACAMFDVNTESMSMTESNVASLTQTQSEDIFSDDFNKEIPLTSTQKESEEMPSGGCNQEIHSLSF